MSEVTHTEENRGREAATNLGKWAMRVKDMKPRDNCFLCDELHWARDCPKRRSLIAKLEEQEREEQSCMGSLQLLEAKPTASTQGDKGLMYVEGKVNGEATQVMVDTEASHHFINAEEAKRVDPNLDGGQGLMKVENTKVKSVEGMARGVELHLGEWREEVNDYGVVLEMELSREFNVAMLPRDKMCIMDGGPYMVPTVDKGNQRRRKSRREPATSKKETRRGRREHRWGRMSRPANVTRPNCPREGNLKKKRLLEWLGSSWKT